MLVSVKSLSAQLRECNGREGRKRMRVRTEGDDLEQAPLIQSKVPMDSGPESACVYTESSAYVL